MRKIYNLPVGINEKIDIFKKYINYLGDKAQLISINPDKESITLECLPVSLDYGTYHLLNLRSSNH